MRRICYYSMKYSPFAARRNPPSNRKATRGRAKSSNIQPRAALFEGEGSASGFTTTFSYSEGHRSTTKLLVGRRDKGGDLPCKSLCAAQRYVTIPDQVIKLPLRIYQYPIKLGSATIRRTYSRERRCSRAKVPQAGLQLLFLIAKVINITRFGINFCLRKKK